MSNRRENVRVTARLRPFLKGEEVKQRCVDIPNPHAVNLLGCCGTQVDQASKTMQTYTFDACYDEKSSQKTLFQEEIIPVLRNAFKGLNTSVLCYGVTGSGKTYTMQGTKAAPGLVPRIAERVFAKQAESNSEIIVKLSLLEIYNNKIKDLLSGKDDLKVLERNKIISVRGLTEETIVSAEHFQTLYLEGLTNRVTKGTDINKHSSRSHAIARIKVFQTIGTKKTVGKLHLIDLAGSENNKLTGNKGDKMTESCQINGSLFALGCVIRAINTNQKNIPYRDNTLTRLLQDSLGGSSCSLMIINISPCAVHFNSTKSTLEFGSQSKKVVNRPVEHIQDMTPEVRGSSSYEALKRKLEKWQAKKKQRLSDSSSSSSSSSSSFSNHENRSKKRKRPASLSSELSTSIAETPLKRKVAKLSEQIDLLTKEQKRQQQKEKKENEEKKNKKKKKAKRRKTEPPVPVTPKAKRKVICAETPITRAAGLIRGAKKLHKAGKVKQALDGFRKAQQLIPENAKLKEKIEQLETKFVGLQPKKPTKRKRNPKSDKENQHEPLPKRGHSASGARALGKDAEEQNTEDPKEQEQRLLHFVNTASKTEILELYGIGKKKAENILLSRQLEPLTPMKLRTAGGFSETGFNTFMKLNRLRM